MTMSQIRTMTVFVSDQDRAKACAALIGAGVTVDGPQELPWGRQSTFSDPDGNGFVPAAR